MKQHSCELVNDLIPLYIEDLCSEESRQIVTEHLMECKTCKNMLEKMNSTVGVKADGDIATLKRIKKRILMEKIGVALAVLIVAIGIFWFAGFYLLNTAVEMDYDDYNLAENVAVEEDEEGNLWLIKQNEATAADIVFPTVSDKNGNYMGYDDTFDSSKRDGLGYTLQQRKINSFASIGMGGNEERTFIGNPDELEVNYIFYYNAENNTEYVLWERN